MLLFMSYDTKHGTECWEKEIVQNKDPSLVALGSAGQWNRSSSRVASAEGFLLLVSPVEPPNIRSL